VLNDLPQELANLAEQTPQVTAMAITKPLSAYETESVSWLWENYLPKGKLVIVEGHPSLGKSTLTCAIASLITRGDTFPCGTSNPPMNVLMIAVEDAPSDTIKPRVMASKGDVEKVFFLEGIKFTTSNEEETADLSNHRHIEAIREAIHKHKIGLIIIDPLMAMIGSRRDAHKDQDVRQITTPLTKLAQDEGVTIICVRHLTKGGGADAITRGGGSIGFSGSARVVVLVAKDPQDDNRRILATVKNNLAPFETSLSFHIINDELTSVGRIEWLGKSELKANDLLLTTSSEDKSALQEAVDFLQEELATGEKTAASIISNAKEYGIAERTLRRAKSQLRIESGKHGKWNWQLPKPNYVEEPLQ